MKVSSRDATTVSTLPRASERTGALGAGVVALGVMLAIALVLVAGALRGGRRQGPPPVSDEQIAQRVLDRYFALLNSGDGARFCTEAISSAALAAQHDVGACSAAVSGYVAAVRRRTFAAALQDMHSLFYEVADAVGSHCAPSGPCSSADFAGWAEQSAPGAVVWLSGSDPRLASSSGGKVVAVVDPRRSDRRRITLYYQAPDGRILRASWRTTAGSWQGSVVDTRAGEPFVSRVSVVAAWRLGGAIVADVDITVGTAAPSLQEFRLVEDGGTWRADSWSAAAGALAA